MIVLKWLLIILIITVLIVIGLVIYPSLKNKDSARKGLAYISQWLEKMKTPASHAPMSNQNDDAARRLNEIERKLNDMNAAIESIRNAAKQNNMSIDKRFNGIADTIIQMQNELNMLKYKPEPKPVPPPQSKNNVTQTDNNDRKILYASRFNNDMNGFAANSLSPDPMGCCYEINIESSNEASYKIVENESVKGEMILVFNQLVAPACSWDEMPVCISAIANDTPGRLYRNGNNWLITRKAKIKLS